MRTVCGDPEDDERQIEASIEMLEQEALEREADLHAGRLSVEEYQVQVACAKAKLAALGDFTIQRNDEIERATRKLIESCEPN